MSWKWLGVWFINIMNMAFSYLERMRMQFCMKLLDIYLSIRKTFLSMISKKNCEQTRDKENSHRISY